MVNSWKQIGKISPHVVVRVPGSGFCGSGFWVGFWVGPDPNFSLTRPIWVLGFLKCNQASGFVHLLFSPSSDRSIFLFLSVFYLII